MEMLATDYDIQLDAEVITVQCVMWSPHRPVPVVGVGEEDIV